MGGYDYNAWGEGVIESSVIWGFTGGGRGTFETWDKANGIIDTGIIEAVDMPNASELVGRGVGDVFYEVEIETPLAPRVSSE